MNSNQVAHELFGFWEIIEPEILGTMQSQVTWQAAVSANHTHTTAHSCCMAVLLLTQPRVLWGSWGPWLQCSLSLALHASENDMACIHSGLDSPPTLPQLGSSSSSCLSIRLLETISRWEFLHKCVTGQPGDWIQPILMCQCCRALKRRLTELS